MVLSQTSTILMLLFTNGFGTSFSFLLVIVKQMQHKKVDKNLMSVTLFNNLQRLQNSNLMSIRQPCITC